MESSVFSVVVILIFASIRNYHGALLLGIIMELIFGVPSKLKKIKTNFFDFTAQRY